ncbi:MAG: DNA-processing protein DprA [Patescibacteria group bacterium]
MYWSDNTIQISKIGDKYYPENLSKIKTPPQQIYYRGNFDKSLFAKSIAIVGSRRITRYGKDVIDKFVSLFAANNVTTISGFMYGVDTQVHQKTVEYGGKTIAVFGCGLDVIYPQENDRLYTQILESGGAVISEYEPKAKPHLWKFPQRNRIVAALASLGVLIIEAGEKSGSLITAKIAWQEGKKVYAVPGNVTSSVSAGTNLLLKKGEAIFVTRAEDILGLKPKAESQNQHPELSLLENKIFKVLKTEPLNADEIAAQIDESVVKVGTTLSIMGLKGLVIESAGKFYLQKLLDR